MDDVVVDQLAGCNRRGGDYAAVAASGGIAVSFGSAEGSGAFDAEADGAGGDDAECGVGFCFECGDAEHGAAIDRNVIAGKRCGSAWRPLATGCSQFYLHITSMW